MQRPAFSVYNASAGSGKTYALVKEYLKIVLSAERNDAYRNILAITFTNKAVHEMKGRIVENLMAFTRETSNEKVMRLMGEIASEIGSPIEKIQEKSRKIISHLIHNYAAFDISTIDKFTHRVIRAFAHDLNLPLSFEVSIDTENLLSEAVDALISRAGEDPTLTKLLIDFTMEKADDDKSWDVSREILETGRLILNENNRSEITHFKDRSIDEFLALKKKLSEECSSLARKSAQIATDALQLIDSNGIEFKSFYSSYVPNHFRKISQGEIEKKTSLYKYLDEIECKRCAAKTPADQKALIDAIADELLKKLQMLNDIASQHMFYSAFLKNLTPLSLLNTVNAELTQIQKEQNMLSIAEFNKLIYEELQSQPAPFIYERMGERYKHFFIDEFQDTSEMQWQNLIPLINNATSAEDLSGERGSVMIVGDPKQSIYRWRGGKAEQFIALGKELEGPPFNPFNNPDKKVINLGRNYRSHEEVVKFNNAFFKLLASEFNDPDYADLYENNSFQEKNDKHGGCVSISFIPDGTSEDAPEKADLYALAVLKTIAEAVANGFNHDEIAILTRKREHGTFIANYLTEQGIRVLSSESLMLDAADEVKMLLSVLRYLKNGSDPEAKARMLLYIGRSGNIEPLHDFIAAGIAMENESDFEAWLKDLAIDADFSAMRRQSVYEAVETAVRNFIGPEGSNAYVQYFLDIILEKDIKGQSGIADFLEYWDKNCGKFSIPVPDSAEGIRIMTIHKSKGLEFPVVIFPFAEEDYSRKPKDKLWIDANEEELGLPRVLIDNSAKVAELGEVAAACYNQKKEEELLDNVNVLYVALTRAEEQLHVISSMNLTSKGEFPKNCTSAFLLKYLESMRMFEVSKSEYIFGSAERVSPKPASRTVSKEISVLNSTINPSAIKIAQRESQMWGTSQQTAIEYGNLLHEILSSVGSIRDIDQAVEAALRNGLIPRSSKAEVRETLLSIVSHPDLADFFSESGTVMNEQSIISSDGPLLRADRIVVKNASEVFLLDYKTGAHLPKYVKQMDVYANALEQMGFNVVKKTLAYIGAEVKTVNL